MDLYTIQSFLGSANTFGSQASAHASFLGSIGSGSMTDRFGSQPFSFMSNQNFGTSIFSSGHNYSLRPDFISRMAFGRSSSLFENGRFLGWIGSSNLSNSPFVSASGSFGPRLQSGLLSILSSTG